MKNVHEFKYPFLIPLSFLIVFLFFNLLMGQDQTYVISRLNIDDGLSHNSVYSIIQDRSGFMWFGSENGLNRFDGYKFKIFRHDPGNDNSLSSSNFGKILQDGDGIFWFATWGGGLDRYDPVTGKFTNYVASEEDSNSLSSNRIEFIFEDYDKTLWIGTDDRGLNHFDKKKKQFTHYFYNPKDIYSLPDNQLKAFLIPDSSSNEIWFGTNSGIAILNRRTGKFRRMVSHNSKPNSLSNNKIRAMIRDNTGRIWIGTRGGGLNVFDQLTQKIKHYKRNSSDPTSLTDNSISCLYLDSNNDIWVGTYTAGLNKFDPKSDSFKHWSFDPSSPYGLSHDRVETIYEDRSKILWIGTRGGGINTIDLKEKYFTWYQFDKNKRGLPNPNVYAITGNFYDRDKIYIGTDGAGLSVFSRKTRTFINHENDLGVFGSSRIWALASDHKNTLWSGAYANGLYAAFYSKQRIGIIKFSEESDSPYKLTNSTIQSILNDSEGSLWIGTADGLNKIIYGENGKPGVSAFFKHAQNDTNSISNNFINTIIEDHSGRLWIGTRLGLNIFDPKTNSFTTLDKLTSTQNSLPDKNINVLIESETHPGWIWVGTEESGLSKIITNPTEEKITVNKIVNFNEEDGLSNNSIRSILEDSRGELWIGTASGLNRFNPDNQKFQIFDLGILFKNQNFINNSAYKTPDGEFFYGTTNGLITFWPAKINSNPFIPGIELTDIKIFNHYIDIPISYFNSKDITLNYDQNYLTLSFAALEYTNPGKNKYAYMLRGVDKDWVPQQNKRDIVYSNLDPGSYIFHIKASNNDGVWNEDGLTLHIIVRPPWWETTWARVLFLLGALLIAIAIIRLRTRQVTRRNIALKEINDRLELSEERFRSIIENAHESIVIIEQNFNITYANDKLCQMVQMDKEMLIGSDIRELLNEETKSKIVKIFLARHQGLDAPSVYEMDLTSFTGYTRRVIISASIIEDKNEKKYTVAQMLDITDRYENEQNLRESEEKYRQVVENASDGIMIESEDRFIFMNKSARRIYGYDLEEFIKLDKYSIIHPQDISGLKKVDALWKKGHKIPLDYQFRIIDKDGQEKWLETNRARIKINDVPASLIVARNITKQVNLEKRLQMAHKMEAIGTLAGGIAHDFNNILSPIIGFSELISEKPDEAEFVKECAEYILQAAKRATDLVSQILAFSHSNEEEKAPVYLQNIIKEAAKLLRAVIPTTIDMELNIGDSVKPIFADATQIHQVIMNLGTNAHHAMSDRGGKLIISVFEKIVEDEDYGEFGILAPGTYALITVEDTGIGIPKEIIDNIFEPFFTTKEKGSGTGMGLAVVHGIVENHGGIVTVYSEPGKGTSFKILLPCMEENIEMEEMNIHQEIQKGQGEKVLVVDDEIAILDLLRRQLEDLNYHPQVFTDSLIALKEFKSNPDQFDIVITDQNMPGLRGDDLCRELRKIDKKIPIVMCTGFSENVDSETAKILGINQFLLKPVMKWELSKALNFAIKEDNKNQNK